MSYCVRCGVKLSSSEKKCPLCNTKVINPNINEQNIEYAYSDKIEEYYKINWKYIVQLSTYILLLISLITVACDLILTGEITWSIYVIGSASYVGSLLSFLYFKNFIISLTIGVLSTQLFVLMIALLNNGFDWYLYLIMPLMFIFGIFAIIFTFMIKNNKRSILRIISFCLLFISFVFLSIEGLTNLYINKALFLNWSLYVALPISIFSVLLILLSYNKKLLEEIKQRVFI